jgi:hypothetical protein
VAAVQRIAPLIPVDKSYVEPTTVVPSPLSPITKGWFPSGVAPSFVMFGAALRTVLAVQIKANKIATVRKNCLVIGSLSSEVFFLLGDWARSNRGTLRRRIWPVSGQCDAVGQTVPRKRQDFFDSPGRRRLALHELAENDLATGR